METKKAKITVVVGLLTLAGLLVYSLNGIAGNLEPSAPPGPTMKTLNEVEPRIPIHASDLPLTITEPNSYYLAENITTGGGGITIDANNVTIDLMGFALTGGTGNGIFVSGSQKNIAIKNGTVSGWSSVGVKAFTADKSQLANLRASDNGSSGLTVGSGSTVTNCTAIGNTSVGISVGGESTVTNCTASQNGSFGIIDNHCSTVTNCTASDNGGTGFSVGPGGTITNCTASDNYRGIEAGDGSTVSGCTASFNTSDGIAVSSRCRVVGNNCASNGTVGDGAGIYVLDENWDSRIEGNNVTANDRGIDVDFPGNLIIKNSASGNTTNYAITADNKVGFIVIAPNSGVINGSTGGAGVGSTDPWANFSF